MSLFLEEHEALLQQLVEVEKQEGVERIKEINRLLYGDAYEREGEQIDLVHRPLKWTHQPLSHAFVTERNPNRGTVGLSDMSLFWRACIERPDQFKQWSSPFSKLEQALAWAEKELLSLSDTTGQSHVQKERARPREDEKPSRPRIDLTPYRIDPADLGPKQLSFRVVFDLHHAPESFKARELSFGKLYRYDEKFPSPAQVARELRADPAQVTVEQLLGPHDEWYRIHSIAVYSKSEEANAQAEQLWSQSAVHALYKEGKIRRARYGFEGGDAVCPMVGRNG